MRLQNIFLAVVCLEAFYLATVTFYLRGSRRFHTKSISVPQWLLASVIAFGIRYVKSSANMYPSSSQSAQFQDQHKSLVSLLDNHASLLVEMRSFCLDSGPAQDLVQIRLNTTETLIATFKQSIELLTEAAKREEPLTPDEPTQIPIPERNSPIVPIPIVGSQKKPVPAKLEADPSGLFTIDTNPTPIEQLYKEKPFQREKHTVAQRAKNFFKRKSPEDDQQPSTNPDTNRSQHDPRHKKSKKNHVRSPPQPTAEDENDDDKEVRQQLEKKRPQPQQQAMLDNSEEDAAANDSDSFIQAVEARALAKEERRKAKAVKKRKRASLDSTESSSGGTGTGTSSKGPKNKKQKHNGSRLHQPIDVNHNLVEGIQAEVSALLAEGQAAFKKATAAVSKQEGRSENNVKKRSSMNGENGENHEDGEQGRAKKRRRGGKHARS